MSQVFKRRFRWLL